MATAPASRNELRRRRAAARLDSELAEFCHVMADEVTGHSSVAQADAQFWRELEFHMRSSGRPALLPNKRGSMRDLDRLSRGIALAARAQAVLVGQLREDGVPWARIGQSAGLTGEGARRRWGA